MPDNSQGAAMEVPLSTQHNRLTFLHPLLLIRPFPSKLDACFHRFCACVHGENHVILEQLGDLAREAAKHGVVEGAGGEGELLRLLNEGGHDTRVTMTLLNRFKSEKFL